MIRPCILHTHQEKLGTTWCGKAAVGFLFQDLDHAANSMVPFASTVLPCRRCLAAARRRLSDAVRSKGESQPKPTTPETQDG
jgi:hypothetical protein